MKRVVISAKEKREICDGEPKGELTEKELSSELIRILVRQGYDYRSDIVDEKALVDNLKAQLDELSRNVSRQERFTFSLEEWNLLYREFLGSTAENACIINRTQKIQGKENETCLKNIGLEDIIDNFLTKIPPKQHIFQVIKHSQNHDLTILINGLPIVHLELRQKGIPLHEHFSQIKEEDEATGLFNFIQIYVLSNGSETRYYSRTTRQSKDEMSFLSTFSWSDSSGNTIDDPRDFAKTFLSPDTLLQILTRYCLCNSKNHLRILRPHQIAASEEIVSRIENSIKSPDQESGGYIWHAPGSGKILTSLKAAQMAMEIPEVDKVIVAVDGEEREWKILWEYMDLLKNSHRQKIDRPHNIDQLRNLLRAGTKRIIVTTTEKLNSLINIRTQKDSRYALSQKDKGQRIVLFMDECHRDQILKEQVFVALFDNRHIFGFTDLPHIKFGKTDKEIDFSETEMSFGSEVHNYSILEAIRDDSLLWFQIEHADQEESPKRTASIVNYIIQNFHHKTNPSSIPNKSKTYNSILATESIDHAINYYTEFQRQLPNINIAIIFSPDQRENTEQSYEALKQPHRDFLFKAIDEYNQTFNCHIDKSNFNNYKKDVAKRVRSKEIDLLIVVDMFLFDFSFPTVNTLWLDKTLEGSQLMRAFLLTAHIHDRNKVHGNIICFKNLHQQVDRTIARFMGSDIAREQILINGGSRRKGEGRGMEDAILSRWPSPWDIQSAKEQREFFWVWSKYLRIFNALSNERENYEKYKRITWEQHQDYNSMYRLISKQYKERDISHLKPDDTAHFELEIIKWNEWYVDNIMSMLSKDHKTNNKEEILKYVRSSEVFKSDGDWLSDFLNLVDQSYVDIQYLELINITLREKIIRGERLQRQGVAKLMEKLTKDKNAKPGESALNTNVVFDDADFILRLHECIDKWNKVKKRAKCKIF